MKGALIAPLKLFKCCTGVLWEKTAPRSKCWVCIMLSSKNLRNKNGSRSAGGGKWNKEKPLGL